MISVAWLQQEGIFDGLNGISAQFYVTCVEKPRLLLDDLASPDGGGVNTLEESQPGTKWMKTIQLSKFIVNSNGKV